MKSPIPKLLSTLTVAFSATVFLGNSVHAQTAYGYNSSGGLFSFSVATPGILTSVGNIGFTPEGIDFNPQNNALFAVDIGATTSSLYTLNLGNALPTLIGTFATAGNVSGNIYDFSNSLSVGFDFNPKTQQAGDGSIRIRLVSSDGDNIRLRSTEVTPGSGVFAAADTRLNGFFTGADGAGYSNNVAATSGTTNLYYIRNGVNELAISAAPNLGGTADTNTGTTLGATPSGGTGLDVYTAADGMTNTGFFVTDSNSNGTSELWRIDNIGISSGDATFVGETTGQALQDIAVMTVVPEPGSIAMLLPAAVGLLGRRRRR